MPRKIADLPTVELSKEELARFARKADDDVRRADEAAERATVPPPVRPRDSSPDLEIQVADEALIAELGPLDDGTDAAMLAELAAALDAEKTAEAAELAWVPYIVASKEDLSWFALEEASNTVLSRIDGRSTVREIALVLGVPAGAVVATVKELQAQGAIEVR